MFFGNIWDNVKYFLAYGLGCMSCRGYGVELVEAVILIFGGNLTYCVNFDSVYFCADFLVDSQFVRTNVNWLEIFLRLNRSFL